METRTCVGEAAPLLLRVAVGGVIVEANVDRGGDAAMSNRELEGTFWFCMKHRRVETFKGCVNSQRIGPFNTEGAAARALQTIAEREKGYAAGGSAWSDDE